MIRYKTIRQFSLESGYTEHAVRAKIRDAVWIEGRVRPPEITQDGNVVYLNRPPGL
jgi:hypothetical protein